MTPPPDQTGGGGWLHNMSAPPTSVITHQTTGMERFARKIAYILPATAGKTELLPGEILELLEPGSDSKHAAAAEEELRARIDAHAGTLELPPAAVVVETLPSDAQQCTDLLTVVTILAKSSSSVYLRKKEPNLAAIRPARCVTLTVPHAWRPS